MVSGHLLTFPGTRTGYARAFADLRRTLDAYPLSPRARFICELAFEEVVTNIIRHGYKDDGEHIIQVAIEPSDDAIVLRFEDDGIHFDPLAFEPITHLKSIRETATGGRGLLLLRSTVERMEYERTHDQKNRFAVTIATTP